MSPPRSNAPDFVKGRISIRVAEFLEFLNAKESEWVRIDIKESRKTSDDGGPVWYGQLDTWVKPEPKVVSKEGGDGLPF